MKAAGADRQSISQRSSSIDLERLSVLRELGPADGWGLLPTVAAAFIQDGRSSLAVMRTAAKAGAGGLAESAHKLKGAAANVGLATVASLCQELEVVAESGERSDIIGLLDELDLALERGTRRLLDVLSERR